MQRGQALKSKYWDPLLGVLLFVLISLLWLDRHLHLKYVAPISTLSQYLERVGQKSLLDAVSTAPLFSQTEPRWNACGEPTTMLLPEKLSIAFALSYGNSAMADLRSEALALTKGLHTDFQPVPTVLSQTFIELNRFIHSRKGFDALEVSLKTLLKHFEGSKFEIPSSIHRALQAFDSAVSRSQCFWHQSNPFNPGWALVKSSGPLFPPRAASVLDPVAIENYFKYASIHSPYPLWFQSEKPEKQIYQTYIVRERPELPASDNYRPLHELAETIAAFHFSAEDTAKSVAWQLRNLTALIDRAARYTPPDANALFVDTMTLFNTKLNAIDASEKDRWAALAWHLISHDLYVVEELQKLRAHRAFTELPEDFDALREQWDLFFRPTFDRHRYWIFSKEMLSPRDRLETILVQFEKNPAIRLNPEIPWLHWWVHGRNLERARVFFQWRQLLLGIGIGMTLLLWSLKRVYSS